MKQKVFISMIVFALFLGVVSFKVNHSFATVTNHEPVRTSDSEVKASTEASEWINEEDNQIAYPVTLESREWENFDTHDEMVEACTIPEGVIRNMSTKDLLQIVLDYPLLCDIVAFNSYQEGFDIVANNFNGIKELLSREDAPSLLLSEYKKDKLLKPNTLNGTEEVARLLAQGNDKEAASIINNNRAVSKAANGDVFNIGNTIHSGVVSNNKTTTIKSKWRSGPLFEHKESYGPKEYFDAPYSNRHLRKQ